MFTFSALEGNRVKLVPLETEHIQPLFECSRNPDIWINYPFSITTTQEMHGFVTKALESRERNEQYPFAVFDKERNEYVGSTRFLRISRLGAVKEGLLRKKYYKMDYFIYGIIDREWKEIRNRLEGYLGNEGT
ncbi:GNAT family N-acetyltransferase [Paenibacillus spongiae]|uniref:GNAT family N-acetyltransferase n=1 Tax=Paenibacillus spongiae TaxID=2909671 RepID=A0ABY5SGJ8_9BACL|nr:GNAT family N-acetyltransferase [Paenibacillus spongiae]UVI33114.1 GNAT family N-acetyltransferase [Paenibacillus spongiae]